MEKGDNLEVPTGLEGVAPTTAGGYNGKITGTTSAMEISANSDFSSSETCGDSETRPLDPGTYYVRYRQTSTHKAGTNYVTVVVPAYGAGTATYTVSFAADGGSGTMADVTGISGEYTLPANGFTAPDGKQFKAWSVNGAEKSVGDQITVNADTTVTAVWEAVSSGHICDIKSVAKVEPTCSENGKEAYYKCDGCGKAYEDALGAREITDIAAWGNLGKRGHSNEIWQSDEWCHWEVCTADGCGASIENSKAAHEDNNSDGKCDICEYNLGVNKPSNSVPQTGDNSVMWLWVALLCVSSFAVTTVFTQKRK